MYKEKKLGPKVSIIMTAYKHERFIREAIRSIISQDFENWELLIGDDNSPDATYDVAKIAANSDKRIKIWRHEKNLGLVENMNFLLSKISKETDYVAFLEWDDLYSESNISERLNIFKINPNIELVISDFEEIDEFEEKLKRKSFFLDFLKYKPNFKKNIALRTSLANMILLFWNPVKSFGSVMVKKSVFERYLPLKSPSWESMFGPLDYATWLKIFPNTLIYRLAKPLLLYRVHGNNFSWQGNQKKMLEQTNLIFKEISKDAEYGTLKAIEFVNLYNNSINDHLSWNKTWSLIKLLKTFQYFWFKHLFNRLKLFLRIILPLEWLAKK